jgi:DNA-binding SARP family transcriptional activator
VRFEILRNTRIVTEDEQISISAPKMETLLTTLLIRSNQVVTSTQLMGEIWGEAPPRRASAALHVYVSQLRKFLSTGDTRTSPIVTRPGGYLLDLGPHSLDLTFFEQHVKEGRIQARMGIHDAATESFQAAMDLTHDPGAKEHHSEGPIVSGFFRYLNEVRLECAEALAEAALRRGQHRELIGRLSTLVAENPLHEAFYRQLMLALYRSGRRADALAVFHAARDRLTQELGLEPCPELYDLHQRILITDHRLQDSYSPI